MRILHYCHHHLDYCLAMSSSTRGERRLRSNTSTDTDVLVFPVTQIDLALRQYERDADSRTLVDQHVPLARQVITLLNDVDFIAPASDPSIQVYVVDVLQQLAFYDAEHGSVRDLETWSQNAWLTLSQAHPRNIAILLGQARHWLWRSYPGAPERPSQLVNGHESGGSSDTGEEPDDDDDDDDDISSPQVVTVRSYLQVSMDFVRAAVREAEAQSIRDGNLFQLVSMHRCCLICSFLTNEGCRNLHCKRDRGTERIKSILL